MNDFRIGQHDEAIRALQADMTIVKTDTRQILLLLSQQKGERKATAKVAALVGAVGGSMSTLLVKVVLAKLGMS